MPYLDESITSIIGFEGSVRWMYLDSRNLVTVGVGHMIPNLAGALTLAFLDGQSQAATQAAITADYNRVAAMTGNQAAAVYHAPTSLQLSDQAVRDLLMLNLQNCDQSLRGHFAGYDAFPDPVKLALLDMVFNLGAAKLFNTYPHFCAAVVAHDWNTAAAQCHRDGPGPARNAWTAQQFQLAAQQPQPAQP